jgi:hypothetical protein
MEPGGEGATAAGRRAASEIWLSPRALKLHAVVLVVVPAFMALCVWQVQRALDGNELSWAYVFEWPLFAGYAVYMWWRLVHERPAPTSVATPTGADGPEARAGMAHAHVDDDVDGGRNEDPELAAYNEYLAQLAERDRAAGR